jgi:hypothetical protein
MRDERIFSHCLLVSFKISGAAIRKKRWKRLWSRFDISLVIQWVAGLGFAVFVSLFVKSLMSRLRAATGTGHTTSRSVA